MSIQNPSDVMALLSASIGQGGLVVSEAQLGEKFFNLSTGLAGELMQKFVNYNTRLAVIVSDRSAYSDRFQELAREHDGHPLIRFIGNQQAAEDWIANT